MNLRANIKSATGAMQLRTRISLTPALSPRRGSAVSSVGTGAKLRDDSQRGSEWFPLPGERVRVRAGHPTNRAVTVKRLPNNSFSNAFTLIELLVVISIIGILAAIGLPAIRGMTRSNAIIASNRQFQDDLTYARQSAIAGHTTVFVVFVPTNVTQLGGSQQITNLYSGQYTSYALLEMRQVGEQPGRSTPKYLTSWRSLPPGVFIAQSKFNFMLHQQNGSGVFNPNFPFASGFPFPDTSNYPPASVLFPYLAFNYLGQLVWLPGYNAATSLLAPDADEYIPLARGSIFYDPLTFAADVQENPPGNSVNNSNVIYINALTGRAKIEQPQLQ
jgi:prepilin-type N-terminal cleavage/methylation domain-containing protein